MANEVKGIKVGDKLFFVTFDGNTIPSDESFKGYILDHEVIDIIDNFVIKLKMIKKPDKEITIDLTNDSPNYLYMTPNRPGWYVGIFTDVRMFFDQYRALIRQLKVTKKKESKNE